MTIDLGARSHGLLVMTCSIFHQGAAKVPACQAPCAAQIENAIVDVDIGLCELCVMSPKSEHRCRFGSNLHEADLADGANGARIVSAFNEDDGLRDVGGQIGLFPQHGPRIISFELTTDFLTARG